MKEKLINALGAFGLVLWYLLSSIIYVLPFVMIGGSFWLTLLLLTIEYFIPISSSVFWVWGLVCAIKGQQDIFAIIYYVVFAVAFIPFFIGIASEIFRRRS